ncbi:MAG: GNAT family N-acetyltransferase [Saprospiraceae bacterium]|nr:GNAT family N-acetyltransferase [Saprospiraceae bacterium]
MNPLDLIRKNFIEKASYFARFVPNMSVEETPYYICVNCGLPSDTFNASVLKSADLEIIPGILIAVSQRFQEKNFPMSWWLWESPNLKAIESLFLEQQFVSNETNVAMWANLENTQPNLIKIPDFEIARVTSLQGIDSHSNILANLFEPSPEAAQVRQYYHHIKPFYDPKDSPMQFFIGKFQDQAVATGTLFFDSDSVGIYDIATLEAARGKGFGSLMFQFLLQFAKEKGATNAVLQASPDGLGIYKRAGFQEAGIVKVFENQHL